MTPRERLQMLLVMVIGFVSAAAVLIWLQFAPAQAAPVEASGGPGVVMCVKTATTGPIDAWLCSPNEGPEFIINSLGFMLLVE